MFALSDGWAVGYGPQGLRPDSPPAGVTHSVALPMYANTPHFFLFSAATTRRQSGTAGGDRFQGRRCRAISHEHPAGSDDLGADSTSEGTTQPDCCESARDQWRFVLQSVDDGRQLAVSEREPDTSGERLELLAVVRGLEALEQPSRVTLVTRSRYVSYGLAHGLDEWRESDWKWERFGRMVPVKNADLWQRIDGALKFHEVECRRWRFDPPADMHLSAQREMQTTSEPLAWLTGSGDTPMGSESDGTARNGERPLALAPGEGCTSTARDASAASRGWTRQGTTSRRETAWGSFGRRLGAMGRSLHRRTSLAASP